MTVGTPPPRPGTPCWASLMVHDLAGSQEFYRSLFGWEFEEGPRQLGLYVRALHEGRPVAGVGEIAADLQRPSAWLPYIATGNADATTAMIRDCGGTLAVGPMDAQQVGRLAIAADVCGGAFGIWEGRTYHGAPFREAPGAPAWTELITPETSLVSKFYSMVFGYEAVPTQALPAGSDHLTLRLGGRSVAGIAGVGSDLPHDRGPHWMTYFSVRDIDRDAVRVGELGGRLLREPHDTPFGIVAAVEDPEGAPFALVDPSRRGATGD
ncbi:VOC family protein [Streptomyces xiamenensis]